MLGSTSVKVHADGIGSLKKRSAKYRTLARRADDQASSTGVGRSSGMEFLAVRWASAWCSGRSPTAPEERSEAPEASDDGPRAPRRRDNQTRRVVEERGAATPVVVRPQAICPPQRSGATVLQAQAVSPRGDVLRQTRPLMFAGFIYLALICEMIRNLVDTTTGQNNHLLNTDED